MDEDTPIPAVAVVTKCPYCGKHHGIDCCELPEPEVTLMLMKVPEPRSVEELEELGPSGHIQAIRELRDQFGLGLKPAVEIVRGELPRALEVGPESVMEKKAEALRQWGCEVTLVAPV